MNSFTASGSVSDIHTKRTDQGTRTIFRLTVYGDDPPLQFTCTAFGNLGDRASDELQDGTWLIGSGKLKPTMYDDERKVIFSLSNYELLGASSNDNE